MGSVVGAVPPSAASQVEELVVGAALSPAASQAEKLVVGAVLPSVASQAEVVGAVPPPAVSQKQEEVTNSVPVRKSWVQVAARPSLSKFNVEVSVVNGKATVVVPDEVLQDSVPLWDDFLVGRFPNSAPHVAKIHVIVNKIWNLGDKTIKIDIYSVNDTMVKFRIRNASARTRVLRRGMWNICDLPMIVSKWTPLAEEAQPEIKSMPMWVKLKNVPPSMFS